MAFSTVSWAYKDTITSAKLAQMVENVRAHNHRSTGQGERIGYLDSGAVVSSVAVTATAGPASVAGYSFALAIPSGLSSGRAVLILHQIGKSIAANTRMAYDLRRGSTDLIAPTSPSFDADVTGATRVPAVAALDVDPPAGTQTYQLFAHKQAGTGAVSVVSWGWIALLI